MAQVQSPNNNGPNPTTPMVVAAPAFIANDTRPLQQRLVDQQWRDVVAQEINLNHPTSLNPDGP